MATHDTPEAEDDATAEPPYLTANEREDLDAVEPNVHRITYSGQDFDVDGLVRRLEKRDILIPTFGHNDESIQAEGFQRAFVWRRPQMDKFIESILLGYPVPGVFLVKQTDNRYLVLDGQQRLLTLQFFKEGVYAGREFYLKQVADDFKGLTYKKLPDEMRRTFDNTFIQAIIVKSDGTDDSLESIYSIFERLNSGGTQLTPHEIRVALYAGPFIDFLESLNQCDAWRNLYGNKSPRLRDQELVLRVIALFWNAHDYQRPLKKFLNDVVAAHRRDTDSDNEEASRLFRKASDLLWTNIGRDALRLGGSQVTAAFAEALLVGLMTRLQKSCTPPTPEEIEAGVNSLKQDTPTKEASTRATADPAQVSTRLQKAIEIFGDQ